MAWVSQGINWGSGHRYSVHRGKHPSYHCWRQHGCRCPGCVKASQTRGTASSDPLDDKGTRVRSKPLSQAELIRLRRMVGVPDEGPPPEPWSGGRPRRKKQPDV